MNIRKNLEKLSNNKTDTKEIKLISKVEKIIYILSFLPYLYINYAVWCGINVSIGNEEILVKDLEALLSVFILYFWSYPIFTVLAILQIIYITIRHKAFDKFTSKVAGFALGWIIGTIISAIIFYFVG